MANNSNYKEALLKKRLKLQKEAADFDYEGERTIVVIPGLNDSPARLKQIPQLHKHEERFLFFLFLLKYKKTKLIYITSKKLTTSLVNYYLEMIFKAEDEKREALNRLFLINLDNPKSISLAQKILESPKTIVKIKKLIDNPKNAHLRCYNSTGFEERLSLKLGIPLYAARERTKIYGTKSAAKAIFRKAEIATIPGINNLKKIKNLANAIAKLAVSYPKCHKILIKLEDKSAGAGNKVFNWTKFIKNVDTEQTTSLEKITEIIYEEFLKYLRQKQGKLSKYLREYKESGGMVELYLETEKQSSPSVQLRATPTGKLKTLSTHEQILSGEKGRYIGCAFPAKKVYRSFIIGQAKKIGRLLVKKGVVGRFAIDFLVLEQPIREIRRRVYPIEINIRKGGTTHPYELTTLVTNAVYNEENGLLYAGKKPIFYFASDNIKDEGYKKLKSEDLIEIVKKTNLNYDPKTKKGIILHLLGTVEKLGRVGITCIGHSRRQAREFYEKFILALNKAVK